jgi:hypothetical protein
MIFTAVALVQPRIPDISLKLGQKACHLAGFFMRVPSSHEALKKLLYSNPPKSSYGVAPSDRPPKKMAKPFFRETRALQSRTVFGNASCYETL